MNKPGWLHRTARTRAAESETPGRKRRGVATTCLIGVLLLAAVVIGLHVRDDSRLSPIDEMQHVDYLDRAAHLEIPRSGQLEGYVARHEVACRGIEVAVTLPSCADAATAADSAFPEMAIDTAAADPPLYYVTTGLAAHIVQPILHLGSVVTAARLLGAAWLAGALILLWLAMGELQADLASRVTVCALLITTPALVISYATVTSDATLLAAGAALLYVLLRWERGGLPGWVVVFVAGLCGLAKTTALVAVGAATVYLLVRWLRGGRGEASAPRERARLLRMAVATAGGGLATAAAWYLLVAARRIPGVPTSGSGPSFYVAHLSPGRVLTQASAMLSPLQNPAILAPLNNSRTVALLALVNVLILAAAFGGLAFARAGSRVEAIAAGAAALMVVSGPVFEVFVYIASHEHIDIPARYGLALIPFAAAVLATVRGVMIRAAAGILAAAAVLFTLVHLATFHPV